jgi:hypothetical protein
MKKLLYIIFLLSIFYTSPVLVHAQNVLPKATTTPTYSASSYELITPIGNISSVKDQDAGGLSGFFNLLIKIAIALAGAIAVIMIIVGGIQYMGTDSIWEKGESVSRMTGAVGGIILLLCSYIILYTINPDLVNIKIGIKKVDESAWQEATTGFAKNSNKLSTSQDVTDAKEICDVSWVDAGCATLKTTDKCKNIFVYIDKLNSDDITKQYIKAWAMEESGCDPLKPNYGGVAAYGIFQFMVPTAQNMTKGCGVEPNVINKDWLENINNTEKIVCMAKNMYEYNKSVCGDNIYNIIAGLEGAGACQKSKNCTDTFSCTNEAHRSWSCVWDDNAHTTRNTGHIETRLAVEKIKYCMDQVK